MQNFRMTVGSEEWVLLTDPDDVAIILNHPTELSKPVERNAAMMPFFGNSVSTSEGERWKSTRKLMAPSFSYKTLEKRIEHVNKYCGRLFEILDNHRDDDDIDMYKYLRPYMFDILCHSLMGVDYNLLDDLQHPYLEASNKVVNIITQNFFSYWRNIRMIFMLTPFYKEMQDTIRTIKDTSTDIIRQRKVKLNQLIEDTKNNNRNVDDDVEQLIEDKVSDDACLLDKFLLSKSNNGDPTPDEIINEELTLVCWTGHYTTTMTMAHTLYCLAKHPEVQRRVFEEQIAIFKADLNKQATNHDLNEMKYLEAAIKESIRVIPTVTKIGRQLNNDLKFTGDKVIPADTTVLVFYEAIYKDPKLFPEPEKYYPERFFSSMHNHAFVPFSAGPRNCLGFRYAWAAMKATLSNMIRKYELTLGNPGTEPQFAYRIITESTNGVHLKLKRRKK
ncbi:cytochrome P450 4d2-like [Leptidea sinapis]|uniref:cytochrome P450 4d2-like n=1 Tax=Leptidea sinapis TaxID=189913 RepID=UPI0021C4A244|nr:cytochrome P450 4d2-like [Leptidea sinapis]